MRLKPTPLDFEKSKPGWLGDVRDGGGTKIHFVESMSTKNKTLKKDKDENRKGEGEMIWHFFVAIIAKG